MASAMIGMYLYHHGLGVWIIHRGVCEVRSHGPGRNCAYGASGGRLGS